MFENFNPIDVTSDVEENQLPFFLENDIKLLLVPFGYLYGNLDSLIQRGDRNLYLLPESYHYFAPTVWDYDFPDSPDHTPMVNFNETDGVGERVDPHEGKILQFNVPEELVMINPAIAIRGYRGEGENMKPAPVAIDDPILYISQDPQERMLMPLVLNSFKGIKPNGSLVHKKFGELERQLVTSNIRN